jgi:hypothetical protein
MVFAIEVKGTLRPGHISRLSAGERRQMSDAWVDKRDNPTMQNATLASGDVYGALVAVNFADMQLRAALSRDFEIFLPVTDERQLDDPSWLRSAT